MYDNYYPDYNRSCSWLITAPIGQRVLIYFTRFKLRNCYQCDCSSVAITDGRQSWSPRLARFCGKDLPGPVYSSGRYMLITFQPETYYYGNQEFQLQYLTLFHHLSSKFFILSKLLLPEDLLMLLPHFVTLKLLCLLSVLNSTKQFELSYIACKCLASHTCTPSALTFYSK